MWFLSSILRARRPAARRRPVSFRTHLNIDVLEARSLPSSLGVHGGEPGHPGEGETGRHGGEIRQTSPTPVMTQSRGGQGQEQENENEQEFENEQEDLKATLTPPAGVMSSAIGRAEFTPATGALEVQARGLAASTTFNITVDGTLVGTLTTDRRGRGEVHLTTNAVTPAAGSTIVLAGADGPVLTGTFAVSSSGQA